MFFTKGCLFGGQEQMCACQFCHLQIMCVGTTNEGNHYHLKVVGDSPEFCRALDSHGRPVIGIGLSLLTVFSLCQIRHGHV